LWGGGALPPHHLLPIYINEIRKKNHAYVSLIFLNCYNIER